MAFLPSRLQIHFILFNSHLFPVGGKQLVKQRWLQKRRKGERLQILPTVCSHAQHCGLAWSLLWHICMKHKLPLRTFLPNKKP